MKKFNEIVTTHQLKEELRKKVAGTHYLEVLNQLLVKKSCDSAWEKIDYNEIITMMPTRVLDSMIRGEKTTC